MTESKLIVKMNCSSCAENIRRILKNDIEWIKVSVPLNIVKVFYDERKIRLEQIISKIKKIGYHAIIE